MHASKYTQCIRTSYSPNLIQFLFQFSERNKVNVIQIENMLAFSGDISVKRGRPSASYPFLNSQFQQYRCPQCPSSFTYDRGLQQHMKYACRQQPRFQCPYCSYKSKWRYNAYNHVRHSHKGQDVFCIDLLDNPS